MKHSLGWLENRSVRRLETTLPCRRCRQKLAASRAAVRLARTVLRTPCAKVRSKYGPCAELTLREELSAHCQLNIRTLLAVYSYTRYCKNVHRPLVNFAPNGWRANLASSECK